MASDFSCIENSSFECIQKFYLFHRFNQNLAGLPSSLVMSPFWPCNLLSGIAGPHCIFVPDFVGVFFLPWYTRLRAKHSILTFSFDFLFSQDGPIRYLWLSKMATTQVMTFFLYFMIIDRPYLYHAWLFEIWICFDKFSNVAVFDTFF